MFLLLGCQLSGEVVGRRCVSLRVVGLDAAGILSDQFDHLLVAWPLCGRSVLCDVGVFLAELVNTYQVEGVQIHPVGRIRAVV